MPTLGRMLHLGTAAALTSVGLGLAGNAQSPSAVDRGEFIAEERCGGCHFAGATVQGTAAPSFIALAARSNLTAERLRDLITTPKHPMPAVPLEAAEIDAVVAYIRSLK
jgi:mono/diheme cytochrome c family protein